VIGDGEDIYRTSTITITIISPVVATATILMLVTIRKSDSTSGGGSIVTVAPYFVVDCKFKLLLIHIFNL